MKDKVTGNTDFGKGTQWKPGTADSRILLRAQCGGTLSQYLNLTVKITKLQNANICIFLRKWQNLLGFDMNCSPDGMHNSPRAWKHQSVRNSLEIYWKVLKCTLKLLVCMLISGL